MIERIILKKAKNLEELILDMVSTPNFILKSVDWGTVQGTHYTHKYVGQAGESITNTSIGMRHVIIEGWIVAKDEAEMSTLKRKLNSFVSPQEAIDLFYGEYSIRFTPDTSVRYSVAYEENNDVFSKFKIEGTCPNPLFADASEHQVAFVTTIPTFHFPLVISESLPEKGVVFGKRMESLIVNVLNEGSVSVGMKIVFRANGTVRNPKLINANTQEEFVINKTLSAGEEIVINTNIGEKSVRGKIGNGAYVNYYIYKHINSPWLQLDVGDNLFRYDAEVGLNNLDVFVYFSNKFLEVQECY